MQANHSEKFSPPTGSFRSLRYHKQLPVNLMNILGLEISELKFRFEVLK
jgi:hypothetical protein